MLEDNSNSHSDSASGHMTFVWNVYNLEMNPSLHRKPIKSPIFGLHPSGKPKYHFELYPRGKTEKETSTHVYIIESKEKEYLKKVKYKCSVNASKLLPGTEAQDCESHRFKQTKKNYEFVMPNHLFLKGDVSLRFEISYEKEKDISTRNEWNSSDEDLDELSSAISKVYDNKLHWDTVLYSGDTSFLIHRAIMHARFPKLAEQINTDNTVSISPNIETDVTKKLLRFMYNGKLNRKNIPSSIYDAMTTEIYTLTESNSTLLGEPHTIFASTRFQKFRFSFVWRIQNFSELKSDENRNYFFEENTPPWTWTRVSFYFSETNEDDIVLSIERNSPICKSIVCRIKVSDLDKTFNHTFDSENLWKMPTFISKNALENKSKNLCNDEIIIDLEIFVSDGTYNSKIDKIDFVPYLENQIPQRNIDLKLFRDDLQNLLNSPKFTDITIATGEENFHAHKFILCARSPRFFRLFEENKKDEITIADISAKVMKSMLKFIYCAEVEITGVGCALELYSASNKYEILSLQSKCARYLKSKLSSWNAVDILLTANACCDQDLKKHVNDFICSNPDIIINSWTWRNAKGNKELVLGLLERALTIIAAKNK